jgi:serine protease Do
MKELKGMERSAGKILIAFASVLSLGLAAQAAQPAPPAQPKTPRAQTYTYWVGDTPGSKGSAYLGVDVADISKDRISSLKLKDEHGVEITMVDHDAPAGKAGLQEHDVVLEFNGARVEGEEQLKRMIHETPAGRKITLGISRDGQMLQLPVTLGERSKTTAWGSSMPMIAPHAMPPMPPMPVMPAMPEFDMPDVNVLVRSYSQSAGMMVDNLTPQLGEFFGVKSGQGVLIRSVEKGSAAETAGLKAGDVIVKIGDEKIADRSDFRRAIRERKTAKVSLGIIRDKKEQSLTITLSTPRSKDSSRLRSRVLRDRDGDLITDDDDDMDIDIDIDDWDGAAALVSQQAQQLAFS